MDNKIPEGATHFTGEAGDMAYWKHTAGCWHRWNEGWLPARPVARPIPLPHTAAATLQPRTAPEYLSEGLRILGERGKEYDPQGTSERSFDAVAEAYNVITGRDLRGSDVCLMLDLVKKVRQYSNPTRLHADSLVDSVNYTGLWAEQLTKELS